jgi:hypothetical protein
MLNETTSVPLSEQDPEMVQLKVIIAAGILKTEFQGTTLEYFRSFDCAELEVVRHLGLLE